ncbi:TetR/AcrR family transcriptional regulator, partial [Parabacteroides sp. OttesenSCG-928-G06]|nr:TetR/AcrR family transcriptional regulator [Parabacteroides sp. OttesenSCG-928-G06]
MQVLKKDIQDNIINTATRLFYNQGFGDTSMRQIADELDMSVSNLYKYFKNKEDLFSEIVKGYYTQYLANFKKFVSHEEKDSFDSDSNLLLAQTIF